MSVGTRKNSLCHWKNSLCPWERGRTRKNPWERGRTYVNVGAASEHQFVRRHLIFIPPSTLEIDEDIPPPISSLTNFPLDHIMHPCVVVHRVQMRTSTSSPVHPAYCGILFIPGTTHRINPYARPSHKALKPVRANIRGGMLQSPCWQETWGQRASRRIDEDYHRRYFFSIQK